MGWYDDNNNPTVDEKYIVKIGTNTNNMVNLAMVPNSMRYLYQDVDYDAGRVSSGLMVRNKQAMKAKLEFTFPPTKDETAISNLLQSVAPEAYYLQYYDPMTAARVTKKFYTGDRTVPVYNFALQIWESVSFNVVEY